MAYIGLIQLKRLL